VQRLIIIVAYEEEVISQTVVGKGNKKQNLINKIFNRHGTSRSPSATDEPLITRTIAHYCKLPALQIAFAQESIFRYVDRSAKFYFYRWVDMDLRPTSCEIMDFCNIIVLSMTLSQFL